MKNNNVKEVSYVYDIDLESITNSYGDVGRTDLDFTVSILS